LNLHGIENTKITYDEDNNTIQLRSSTNGDCFFHALLQMIEPSIIAKGYMGYEGLKFAWDIQTREQEAPLGGRTE
jgi:hypothetical protein